MDKISKLQEKLNELQTAYDSIPELCEELEKLALEISIKEVLENEQKPTLRKMIDWIRKMRNGISRDFQRVEDSLVLLEDEKLNRRFTFDNKIINLYELKYDYFELVPENSEASKELRIIDLDVFVQTVELINTKKYSNYIYLVKTSMEDKMIGELFPELNKFSSDYSKKEAFFKEFMEKNFTPEDWMLVTLNKSK
jgi:hypothetical protein